MSDETRRIESLLLQIPYEIGAIVGVFVFLLGYLVTLVTTVVFEREYIQESIVAETGQLYYSAMFVEMQARIDLEAIATVEGEALQGNVLLTEGASAVFTLPVFVYHLIPVLVFVLGGFIAARWVGAQNVRKGVLSGLSLPVGTHLPAIVGTLVFSTEAGGPEFWHSLVLAGVVVPGVCGVAGGIIAVASSR